jgi:hypothetical protein
MVKAKANQPAGTDFEELGHVVTISTSIDRFSLGPRFTLVIAGTQHDITVKLPGWCARKIKGLCPVIGCKDTCKHTI